MALPPLVPTRGPPDLPVRWFYAVDSPRKKAAAASPASLSSGGGDGDGLAPSSAGSSTHRLNINNSRSTSDISAPSARSQCLSPGRRMRAQSSNSSPSVASTPTASPAASVKDPTFWKPFSNRDSAALEAAFQSGEVGAKVPVNEDYLFEVDVDARELAPVFWEGAVHNVRRGTWSYSDGSGGAWPCDENLARQVEDGYKKHAAWTIVEDGHEQADSEHGARAARGELRWPLLGPYHDYSAVYVSATQAWFLSDGILGKLAKVMWSKLSPQKLGAKLLVRGYDEARSFGKTEDKAKRAALVLTKSAAELATEAAASPTAVPQLTAESRGEEENAGSINKGEEDDKPERRIDHLVLVIHGIGQKLGERVESIDFVKEVGNLRQSLKLASENFQASAGAQSWPCPPVPTPAAPKASETAKPPTAARPPLATGAKAENPPRVSVEATPPPQLLLSSSHSKLPSAATTAGIEVQHVPLSTGSDGPGGDGRTLPTSPELSDYFTPVTAFPGGPRRMSRMIPERRERTPPTPISRYSSAEDFGEFPDAGAAAFSLSAADGSEPPTIGDLATEPDESSTLNGTLPTLSAIPSGRGVQVLPIQWRQSVKFGMASADDDADESPFPTDLTEQSSFDSIPGSSGPPTLREITVDGVPTIRALVTDVFLDVLLYMIPKYHEIITEAVAAEMNRVYHLFVSRNPDFLKRRGRVSVLGHSLGSVISFDVLCSQVPERDGKQLPSGLRKLQLDFPVENFFAVGSPLGLFLLLKGCHIVPRMPKVDLEVNSPIVQPACKHLYNIFHNADPVAFRVEPMVGRFFAADSSLRKPALVPYFKGGLKGRLLNIQEGVARNVSGLYDAVRSAVVSPFVRLKRATSVSSGVSAESVSAGVDGGGEEFPEQQQQQQQRPQQEEPARDRLPLSPAERLRLLNPKTGRVDWCLQEGLLENAYLSALLVHLTYWSDYDIAMFILRQCYS